MRVPTISDGSREIARRLPEEFLQGSDGPVERVVELVSLYWGSYEEKQRAELAQALLAVLEGLHVTNGHRNDCEAVVLAWLSKQ